MKKTLFASALALSTIALAPLAVAQTLSTLTANGGICFSSGSCASGYCDAGPGTFNTNTCQINPHTIPTVTTPAVTPTNTGILPTTCTPACSPSQICASGFCITNLSQEVTNTVSDQGLPVVQSGFVPLAPIPGLTADRNGNALIGTLDLASFLNNLYAYLIGVAALLAVIQIIRGGLEIATQDNVGKHTDGRHHIEQAILGLVLALLPALVFHIINPSITQLSLNLPPLNTAAGTSTVAVAAAPPVNGKPSGVYLQKLTTADQTQVQNFINSCGSAGGALTNSCPTTNSQTGAPNCSGSSTLECEHYAPVDSSAGTNQTVWLFYGAPSLADVIPNLKDTTLFAVSTTALIPAVSAEIARDTQFITQCNVDGGQVCATDSTFTIENYDYISCPAASQQPAWSRPVGTEPYCFKLALFCADPSLPTNGCTSGWSFQLSQSQ